MLAAATGTKAVVPEPPKEPEPDPEEPEPEPNHPKEILFRTLLDGQNIRSTPSTASRRTVIAKASIGQILGPPIEIHIENRMEVWFKFEEGWMAAVYGGRQYLIEI